MNTDPHLFDTDVQDALVAWQGGELPPGRVNALLERLRLDAAFRAALARQAWTLSLTKVAQAPDPRWLALHEELGLHAAAPRQRVAAAGPPLEESLMGLVRAEPLRFVAAWWRWVAAGAVAALIVVSAVLLLNNDGAPMPSSAAQLAVLVPGENAVWRPGASAAAGRSRLVGAGPLQLIAGQARLLFTNGVILDLEGPADLQLVSVERVICHEGRLRTNVPPGAEGFCVETPRGAVTDLGTELGISVSRAGKTNVAVFEGQAEVSVQMPGQAGVRTALLNQSEQAEFEPGSGAIHAGSSDPPPDVPPLALPALRLAPDYAQRVLAAQPVHYWRLNRVEEDRIPNEVAGGATLRAAGGAVLQGQKEGGQGTIQFQGRRQPGVLYAGQSWRTPDKHHAVEFWFVADTLEQMALAAVTTTAADRPHVALVELGGRRAGHDFSAGSVRYLLRWPPGHRDGMNLYSPPVALPYQWHHVVAQHEAGRLHLFLDGRGIGSTQADAAPAPVDCLLQFGALEHRPGRGLSQLRRPFSGRMAEIAVYDRLLTADEIRWHAAAVNGR